MAGRYKAYPAYKDSGVEWLGEIPEGWNILRGKYIFSEINQRSSTGSEVLLSVSEYFGVKPRSESFLDDEFISRAESLEGYKKCSVNDLVINIMLAWKCGLGVSKYDGIVSPAYSVFRFFESIYPDYMHYLYRTEIYNLYFKSRSTGIIDSRLRLYPESFLDIKTLIPSKSEQQTIAQFLDYETAKIDALIAKQEQLIALLKEKRQAVISHAVTKGLNPDAPMKDSGVEWLGQVPEHWETPKLNYITSRVGDGLHSTPKYEDCTGYYFINGNNLVDGSIVYKFNAKEVPESEYINNYIPLNDKTVLLSINGTIGNVAIYTGEPVILGKSAAYIMCSDAISVVFLSIYFTSSQVRKYFDLEVTGTTIFNLSLNSLRKMPICLAPLNEQLEIEQFCMTQKAKYQKLIENAERIIKLLQERKTALISAAVTGKIDVRDWQPPSVG